MMEIREATEADIPAIVALLKISLGENLMPKSDRYWRWKHLENPFGPSPVLLCWEGGNLIGVRAFMRWRWMWEQKNYHAVRAVDTATHPGHQGKGIFKKLTLSLVERCRHEDHFVFNTPNQQSKPGYIKMGWQEAGKLPIALSVQRPINLLRNLLSQNKTTHTEAADDRSRIQYYLNHPQLSALINNQRRVTGLVTNVSVSYLKWRYVDVPVAHYIAIGCERGKELTGLVFGRIKLSRFGREFRITDCFFKDDGAANELVAAVTEYKKANSIDFSTISGVAEQGHKQMMDPLHLKVRLGPIVTIRQLGLTDLSILQHFNRWAPSLGDLELF
jgi:hypothetical protein